MQRPQTDKHRINRVQFILQTDTALATQVQQQCSQVFHQQLQAQLSNVLNQYGPMQLDTLTLDIGQIAWHAFDTQLRDRVLEQLALQLSKFSRAICPREAEKGAALNPVAQDHADIKDQNGVADKVSTSRPLSANQPPSQFESDLRSSASEVAKRFPDDPAAAQSESNSDLPPSSLDVARRSSARPFVVQSEPNLPSARSEQSSSQLESDQSLSASEVAKRFPDNPTATQFESNSDLPPSSPDVARHSSTSPLIVQSEPNLPSAGSEQSSSQLESDLPLSASEAAKRFSDDPVAAQFESYLHSGLLAKPAWLGAEEWLLGNVRTNPRAWYPLLARCCVQHRSLQRLLQLYNPDTLRSISHQLSGSSKRLAQSDHDTPAPYLILGALRYFQLQPTLAMPVADGVLQADTVQPELAMWLEPLQAERPSPILQQWLRPLFDQPQLHSRLKQYVPPPLIVKLQALLKAQPLTHEQLKSTVCRVPASILVASPDRPVPVSNAGLILLWPLLPGFLTHLGLLKNKAFINEEAQHKAVCWLDWLIWNDGDIHSYDRTPLTRYICGLPLDTQIDSWHSPPEAQRAEMQQWLNGLPSLLPGLHRCSADDLRHLFMQRPGSLNIQKSPCTLDIEPNASDILLAQIPWPLHSILLPWMTEALEVVWPITYTL